MSNSDFLTNPWLVGSGVTVIGGLILYYVFGVGRTKDKKGISYKKTPHISATGGISAGRDIIVGSKIGRRTKQKKVKPEMGIRIDLAEQKVEWEKFAVSRWVWPSFRIILSINNFHNRSPEYIRAHLVAKTTGGIWEAKNFVFIDRDSEDKSKANEDYRVEPKSKEKISLFVSNYDIGASERKPIPDIDRDTLKLVIETESGKKIIIPIKPGWIVGN